MPMRDPRLPKDGIAKVNERPKHDFSSPEDDMTLRQWLSFSWVGCLLAVGSAKKLDFEDVWTLAFEFRHRPIFDRFRTLPGSVLRRLLAANGRDVLITSLISTIETIMGAQYRIT